jgi:hypothetical protein
MFTKEQAALLEQYNAALSLYKQRRWKDALAAFQKGLDIVPEDGPSKLYIQRCEAYIENPPEDDWDGVFVMKTK